MKKILHYIISKITGKQTIEQRRNKVLTDTVKYFNTTTRNANDNGGGCQYYPIHEKSEGCAVGRLIKDKKLCKRLDGNIDGTGVSRVFDQLPSEVQELGKEFLSRLQRLHDFKFNWYETGLSPEGVRAVEEIKKEFTY